MVRSSVRLGLVLMVIGMLVWLFPPGGRRKGVEAQGGFAGQNSFQVPFHSVPQSSTPQVIVIPNRNQLAHTVTFTWTVAGGMPIGVCSMLLDGSNDGQTWQTMAATSVLTGSGTTTGLIYANGYFNFLRLKFSACQLGGAVGVYTGYAVPLPINQMADRLTQTNYSSIFAVADYETPYLLLSFQCFNPNGSTGYLQLWKSATTPVLGGPGYFYQIGIPGGATFNYDGAAIPSKAMLGGTFPGEPLWAAVTTTPGGAVPVATGLPCSFQTTGSSPFYPINPVSP